MNADLPPVAIIGGSIAGLTAALTRCCIGSEVDVYERWLHNCTGTPRQP